MGTQTLSTLPQATQALANDLVLLHKMPEDETYAVKVSDFRTIIEEGFEINLSSVQGAGALAALDSIDIGDGLLTGLGALAELDEVGWINFTANPYMSMWSSGGSANPDGFTTSGSPTITREASIKPDGATYSAKVVAGVSAGYFRHVVSSSNDDRIAGNPISLSAWVYASTASAVRLRVSDTDGADTTETFSDYHPGDSAWHLLAVDGHTVQSDYTAVYCDLEVAAGETAYVTIWAVIQGSRAPRFTLNRSWINASGSSGFYNNGTYLGFYRSDGWRVYLDSSGNFICRTNSGDYAFRYYGTASGAYGEGDVFIGSAVAGEGSMWWDQSAKNFQLDGDFRVISGGDIRLIGAASNPGKVTWDGTSHEVEAFMTAAGDDFYIRPTSYTGLDLYIGTTAIPFGYIYLAARQCYVQAYYNSNNNAYLYTLANSGTSSILLMSKKLGTVRQAGLEYINTNSSWSFAPGNGSTAQGLTGGVDLGTNAYYWKTVECVTLDDSHDVSWLDEHDDLGDMMKIGPKVDAQGEPVRDPKTGNQIVDDATLPDYICTKVDGQVHWRGDRTHGPNAAFHGWLLGGIKQLYSMVNSSFAQVNSSYAALDARITRMEQGGKIDAV